VFNSERTLEPLVARLGALFSHLGGESEVILVNDRSSDGSWDGVCRLHECHEWVRGINLLRNYGQHNALLCGIRAARYSVVVTIDDDLQHPPEEIPKLLAVLEGSFDVAYGTPEHRQHGFWRDFASVVTKLALRNMMGSFTATHVSAFRAFRTQLRDAFTDYHGAFVSIDVLLTWGTTRFGVVTVRHDPRQIGVSNYSLRKLVVHALNMVTGYTTFPLRVASLVGGAFTLLGGGVFMFVIGRYMMLGQSVAGFPFLASIISVFAGAQLFAIGIIGEYLGRMHFRMMERPAYAIAAETGPRA
jgi:undecaprenyl-phosphate 4-deoxy-4-formamido-L-arabinose transferase